MVSCDWDAIGVGKNQLELFKIRNIWKRLSASYGIGRMKAWDEEEKVKAKM
jgi:hypothetical protein